MTNVLAISLGGSPAVVTETIWALYHQNGEPFRIDELHIATTRGAFEQKKMSRVVRVGPDQDIGAGDKLQELFDELGEPQPELRVWIPVRADGRQVEDIRTEEDSIAFGDMVNEMVHHITRRKDTVLHLSIAGGRKTMSFHAGSAMTLYGRARDDISHVLVTPWEAEMIADFWWPERDGRGSPDEARAAAAVSVQLVRTPYFRARRHLPAEHLDRTLSYNRMVSLANAAQDPKGLLVDLGELRIVIGGVEIKGFTYTQLAIWALMALRAKGGEPRLVVADLAHKGALRAELDRLLARIPGYRFRALQGRGAGRLDNQVTDLLKRQEQALVYEEIFERLGIVKDGRGALRLAAPADQIEVRFEAEG